MFYNMTTTQTNMLAMHQSDLVLGFGKSDLISSFPVNAERLQVVYPSTGKVSPWLPNTGLSFRTLLDKNSAMSLHGSYLQVTFSIGRVANWTGSTVPPVGPTANSTNGIGTATSFDQLQALDAMDRIFLYTHWNPMRLIANSNLYLGSSNVESVNNAPLIADAKSAFYSQEAMRKNLSDVFCTPVDGSIATHGTPLIHPYATVGTPNTFLEEWNDTSISVFQVFGIQPKNMQTVVDGSQYGSWSAAQQICVEPLEYFIRNSQYAFPVGAQYNQLASAITNDAPISFYVPSAEVNSSTGVVNYFDYSSALSASSTASAPINGLQPLGAYPSGENENTVCRVTKRIPLSMLFGFAEQNCLVPSNLLQVDLTRARDEEMIRNLWVPLGTGGVPQATRQYAVYVEDMRLIVKYYDLNQSSADILSQDQLLAVNHYSVFQNEISGAGISGSVSLQSFAGLKALIVRMQPSWACAGQSIPVGQTGNLQVIYRGKVTPLQATDYNFKLAPPGVGSVGVGNTLYQGGAMLRCDPSTYFESYSSYNGNAWNGMSAALCIPTGNSVSTWAKSQFTVPFAFTEDQSMNSDTVACPIQLYYSFGQPLYDLSLLNANSPSYQIPDPNPKVSINIVFVRTNLIKYLGASRQYTFITNGSS